VQRIARLSNLNHETDLLEEIIDHVVQGAPLQKVTERNRDLLEFQASFAAREKRVWELDKTGLSPIYLKGLSYLAHRAFRSNATSLKRFFK